MIRTLITLAAGIGVGAGAMNAAHHDDGEKVREISVTDIKEKLDGKDARATFVEVTIEPGQSGVPHRHPGPAFVYVLEGEWETGIDDLPTKVLKAGRSSLLSNEPIARILSEAETCDACYWPWRLLPARSAG